jgi:hydroxymethylbilane synthase
MTGSLRRRSQILIRRPDVVVEPLRGNINTRIRKWRERGHAGLILAAAGLARLGEDPDFADAPVHPLDPEILVPAPGQGILALEVKAGSAAQEVCATLNHEPSARAAAAERAVVAAFGGDCTLPLAAWARDGGMSNGWKLTAVLATPNGERHVRAEAAGTDVDEIAGRCVEEMHSQGAADILAAIGK